MILSFALWKKGDVPKMQCLVNKCKHFGAKIYVEINYFFLWKQPVKKNEYTSGNNLSRIYSDPPPKVKHKPITKIISNQLGIKLGQIMQEEFDSGLRKIKNRKTAGLDEIPPEVWKTKEFDDILLRYCK